MGEGVGTRSAVARWRRAAELRESDPDGIQRLSPNCWLVRSSKGSGSYRVTYDSPKSAWACECADFLDWRDPCKHIFRVYLEWFPGAAPPTSTPPEAKDRKTYRQEWSTYNAAQQEEIRLFDQLLRALVDTVDDPMPASGGRGRPRIPFGDLLFCSIQKVYSQLSCRRGRGLHFVAREKGLLKRAPGFVSSSRLLNRVDVTHVLEALVTRSALPLSVLEDNFAVDSTGLQTTDFGAWREARHGEKRVRHWMKAHALVGVKTHVVARVVVTEKDGADYPQFDYLLKSARDNGFVPEEVYADKAYTGRSNYRLAEDMGFELFAPFKSNSNVRKSSRNKSGRFPDRGSSQIWKKAFLYFQLHRDEFERHYHKRSNVEAVFSALKRKLGEQVRSKNPVAQQNEVLAKIIAYNLTVLIHEIYEHGVVPDFLAPSVGPPSPT